MTQETKPLDPHGRPEESLRHLYKAYQKLSRDRLDEATEVLDFGPDLKFGHNQAVVEGHRISSATVKAACNYLRNSADSNILMTDHDVQVYEASDIPGLQVIPSLIPSRAQLDLLSLLLHRDLADQRHKTNVHLHHSIPYHALYSNGPSLAKSKRQSTMSSFFDMSPDCQDLFTPRDANKHKSFTVSHFLNRKLRWVTLGGQYDWTQKNYPNNNPLFPEDIAAFVQGLFPETKAEAAIVNVYQPGDTLSLHRDVSEESKSGLVSISLGCDGLFVIGQNSREDQHPRSLVMRLRSGDAVYMSGSARFAWHGVPQIIPETCPEWLCSWPAAGKADAGKNDVNNIYELWRDWMSNKRINLNVRQMKA